MWNTRRVLWAISQTIAASAMFLIFIIIMPWLTAEPINQLPADRAATANLPIDCPAFNSDHGQITCQWLGTAHSNENAFIFLVSLSIACYFYLMFTAYTDRGFSLKRVKKETPSAGT